MLSIPDSKFLEPTVEIPELANTKDRVAGEDNERYITLLSGVEKKLESINTDRITGGIRTGGI
jgi:hypothetical protein